MDLARVVPGAYAVQKSAPILRQLLYLIPQNKAYDKDANNDIIRVDYYSKANEILTHFGVKYVTIQKKFIHDKQVMKDLDDFMSQHVQVDEKYEDDDLLAYKIAQRTPKGHFAAINTESQKWTDDTMDASSKKNIRVAFDGADIRLVNMESVPKIIRFKMEAKSDIPFEVALRVKNGKEITRFTTISLWEAKSWGVTVPPGTHLFKFDILEKEEKEITADTDRSEGVKVANIFIEEIE